MIYSFLLSALPKSSVAIIYSVPMHQSPFTQRALYGRSKEEHICAINTDPHLFTPWEFSHVLIGPVNITPTTRLRLSMSVGVVDGRFA